jgi:nucleotide sugar dehydrogenase
MRVGVIGGGVVGQAIARSYLEHVEEVRVYDIDKTRGTHSLVDTLECTLIFICLPTPQKVPGMAGGDPNYSMQCNTSVIDKFFEQHKGYRKNFVIRSTVPIGTTARIQREYDIPNICHSPEFLTARCAYSDASIPSRNIIGCPVWENNEATRALEYLYTHRFSNTMLYTMSSNESEAVKLFTNGFFSVKVAYFNEINSLCEKMGLDWYQVWAGVLGDGRISPYHTKVPGPDGKYGFGPDTPNACLPKDLANLITMFREQDVRCPVAEGAHTRNSWDRARKQ